MRFFADQDVYLATTQFLRTRGHEVLTAAEAGMSTSPDHELLADWTAFSSRETVILEGSSLSNDWNRESSICG